MDTARTPLSEAEFEEIMNRNRAISSSAISRAVSDASAGMCISFCIILVYVTMNDRFCIVVIYIFPSQFLSFI